MLPTHRTVTDAIRLSGNVRETDIGLTTSAAQTGALVDAIYDVRPDVDCFTKVGTDAITGLTPSTGYPHPANTTIPYIVNAGEKIGAIVASGTGTLRLHKVS